MRPVGKTLLAYDVEKQVDKEGEIYIPEVVKRKTRLLKISSFGTGLKDEPVVSHPDFKEGDIIIVDWKSTTEATISGEKLVIVDLDGVIGVVEDYA